MTHAFILDGVRSAVGNIGGQLSEVRPDDLAAHVIRTLLARHSSLDGARVADVVLGCASSVRMTCAARSSGRTSLSCPPMLPTAERTPSRMNA